MRRVWALVAGAAVLAGCARRGASPEAPERANRLVIARLPPP